MACFQQRSAYDYCLILGRGILFPDHDCKVLRNIWVKTSSFRVSRTDGTGDLLLDGQDAGVNGQFWNYILGKARPKIGCEMGNRPKSRGHRDANGKLQRDVGNLRKDNSSMTAVSKNDLTEPELTTPEARLATGRDTKFFVQNFDVRKLGTNIFNLQIVYGNYDVSVSLWRWPTRDL